MAHNLLGIERTDARHLLQLCRVGSIQYDVLTVLDFDRILNGVTLKGFVLLLSGKKRCCRLIVLGDTDIGCQFTILFDGEPIESGKILLTAVDASPTAITIDVAHLPRLQTKA